MNAATREDVLLCDELSMVVRRAVVNRDMAIGDVARRMLAYAVGLCTNPEVLGMTPDAVGVAAEGAAIVIEADRAAQKTAVRS